MFTELDVQRIQREEGDCCWKNSLRRCQVFGVLIGVRNHNRVDWHSKNQEGAGLCLA